MTINPYDPPRVAELHQADFIADELVQRLLDGKETETIAVYDVSDCCLYGRKHRRELEGELAAAAESTGFFPEVYQAVYWACFAFVPVWPLGTYVVMYAKECDDPDGDAEQYRGLRVAPDRGQIVIHYAVAYSVVLAAPVIVGLAVRQLG